jgi:hypothetical protein
MDYLRRQFCKTKLRATTIRRGLAERDFPGRSIAGPANPEKLNRSFRGISKNFERSS